MSVQRDRVAATWLILAALLAAPGGALAQPPQGGTPSTGPGASSAGAARSTAEDGAPGELPVSLNRIRAGLTRPLTQPLFSRIDERPHFSITIEEEQKFQELLEGLKFEPVLVPPGGVYAHEQQRLAFNPTSRPLMQPYAAFNGGQLLTIAIENLIARYLGGPLLRSISAAGRAEAEAAARAEVERAVREYCAAQPDPSGLLLCRAPADAATPTR
jgi:hypothetical protein